jgi:hypothetical protein
MLLKFEAGRTPINELDGTLGLDGRDSGVDILGDDISAVHHAAGHVLSMTGITLRHHRRGLEGGVGDLGHTELLVVRLLRRDHGGIRRQHEVDSGVRHQVGLELSDIDVECTIETERGGQRGDDLRDEAVQVGVGGALNVEGTTADIVHSFVIKHDGDISVLEQRVRGQHTVVRLNDGGRHLRGRVDREAELGLLALWNDTATIKQQRTRRGQTYTRGSKEQQVKAAAACVCAVN